MATSREDAETQELNLILKSLEEGSNENGIIWKACAESGCLLLSLLQDVFRTEIGFTLRLYGSSAEDLKSSMAADDIGDYDIMVIPSSEYLLIDDEMIEYLPQHPLHVRVKGRDHTLLQSCLVEDTPYVATSAIKEFHPLIYGTEASALKMVPRLLQAVVTSSIWGRDSNIGEWENKEAGPALQLNFDHSFSISEFAKSLTNKHSFPNYDLAEIEYMFFLICQAYGDEYTKEQAELSEKMVKFYNDFKMSWQDNNPQLLIHALPRLAVEFILMSIEYGAGMAALPANQSGECLAYTEERSDEERGEESDEEIVTLEDSFLFHLSDGEKVSQETMPSNGGSFLTPENAHGSQKIAEDLKPTASQLPMGGSSELSHKQSSQLSMSKEVSETDLNKDKEQRKNESQNDSKSEADMSEEQPLAKKGEPSCPDHFFLDHLLGPLSEVRKETDAKETVPTVVGGIDMVPSLRCPGWPQVAWDWVERDRKWPSPDVVEKVVQEGFHLVVKPPKNGGNPECNFRISFSHAEYLLSQEMNEVQRGCYCCLKKFHRTYLSKDPEGLVSFHLKTLLLWTIEETGAEVWTESNRVECFMKLCRNLLQALTKKELPHFFVRSYNLLGADYVDDPKILETLARKVKKMVEDPMLSVKELIQKVPELEKGKNTLSTKPTITIKTASEQGNAVEREETPHNDSRVALTPVKEGASCSVASSGPGYRFHDLKEIYTVIIQELISLALTHGDDQTIEALEPLERALVGDIREMFKGENVEIVLINELFEKMWNLLYPKIWMNPEPNMRHCMLVAIQELLEALREDDTESNVDSFSFHHLVPPGIMTEMFSRIMNKITRSTAKMDEGDIPQH